MSDKAILVTNVIFYCTLGVAVVLLVAGFILPPMGIIDSSVIQASGILMGFSVIAQVPNWIKAAKSVKVQHGDTSIEVVTKTRKKKSESK